MNFAALLSALDLRPDLNNGLGGIPQAPIGTGPILDSIDPATGQCIARIQTASAEQTTQLISAAHDRFLRWRNTPAPRRGELVRELGDELRAKRRELGALVALEMGKIQAEGEGEVQEMIDICDFAVGLSRQLHGLTIASERPDHRLMEQWHPLGVVGIVSAFNFPVAVWSWNSAIAAVCGDTMIWKPSSETPLCALAVQKICDRLMAKHDAWGLFTAAIGSARSVGQALVADPRIGLISATGSCQMGREIAKVAADRMARTILELGGNNAVIVLEDANLDLATRAILFGAVGTAGQRCTSTRRVLVSRKIAGRLTESLLSAYRQVAIGDPRDPATLMGPLINERAIDDMQQALSAVKAQGGEILYGGKRLDRPGFFVEPCLVKARADMPIVAEETFAPILYLIEVDSLEEAIAINNGVPQGLSSAIFTSDFRSAERFVSPAGSDCGIANVNAGTSGAEIGGAFGGEKETGGGREAGSDSWKAYMRRQTCTINYGTALPLAQGIRFGS
jgi:aldehyde dehydrogenase (NAD+)